MLDDARLKGSPRAHAVRDQLSRAGGLKLTAPAGTVPQAAIRRRHKPSLPRVSIERSSEARWQDVVEENQQIGAGRDRSQGTRQRVLTKVDRLYQDGAIDRDQWNAAGHLRNWIMLEWGASEGCSSYGEPRGSADRYGKADRHAARILRNDTSRRRLADAVFATCGLFDQDGTRIIDVAEATVLIEAIARTTNPPTLTAIGE